jgi:hypothetical protein
MKKVFTSLLIFCACLPLLSAANIIQDWTRLKKSCQGIFLYLERNDSYTFYFAPQSTGKQVIVAQTQNLNADVDVYIYDKEGSLVYSSSNIGNETVTITPATEEDAYYIKVFMRSGQDKVRILAGRDWDVTSYQMLFD